MWEILKQKVRDFDMQGVWMIFFLVVCIGFSSLIYTFFKTPKDVRYYYLQTNSTTAGISYQIWADIDWCEDRLAFSSSDPELTMKVFRELPHKP